MILVKTLLILGSAEILGLLVLNLLKDKRDQRDWAAWLGLGFGIGLGFPIMVVFYLAWVGVPISGSLWIGVWGILILLSAFPVFFRPAQYLNSIKAWFSDSPLRQSDWIHKSFLVFVLVIWGMTLWDSASQPLVSFDARAIWAMKARVIADAGSFYTEDFLDVTRLHAHQRYPLLIPLAECAIFQVTGSSGDSCLKLLFPFFFGALLLFVYARVARQTSAAWAAGTVSALASLPAYLLYANGGVASGYGDIALSYFAVIAASNGVDFWQTGNSRALWIFVWFSVLAVFTKNEGAAIIGIIVVLTPLYALWTGWMSSRKLLATLGSGLLIGLMLFPWVMLVSRLPNIDEDYLSRITPQLLRAGLDRFPFLTHSFLKEFFFKPHLWNMAGFLLLFSVFNRRKNLPPSSHYFFCWVPVVYQGLLFLIFMVSPWSLVELVPVTLSRLWLQIMPMFFVWMSVQFYEGTKRNNSD
jgi:hypothetical protein